MLGTCEIQPPPKDARGRARRHGSERVDTLLGEICGVRALEKSAEAVVVKRRGERGKERRAKEPREQRKAKLANREAEQGHATREDAITANLYRPDGEGLGGGITTT